MGHKAGTKEAIDACSILVIKFEVKILLCFRSRRCEDKIKIKGFNWLKYNSVIVPFTTIRNIRVLQKAENCSEELRNCHLLKKEPAL